MKLGIMSDTHGVFRDEWTGQLQGCDCLIHAGDIDTRKCYDKLKETGIPLYMVRGNCDRGSWADYIPESLQVPIGGKIFYITHNKSHLPFDLTDADFIIFGHTHQYTSYERFGKVFINPGSAGQPRGSQAGMVILELTGDSYELKRILL